MDETEKLICQTIRVVKPDNTASLRKIIPISDIMKIEPRDVTMLDIPNTSRTACF